MIVGVVVVHFISHSGAIAIYVVQFYIHEMFEFEIVTETEQFQSDLLDHPLT